MKIREYGTHGPAVVINALLATAAAAASASVALLSSYFSLHFSAIIIFVIITALIARVWFFLSLSLTLSISVPYFPSLSVCLQLSVHACKGNQTFNYACDRLTELVFLNKAMHEDNNLNINN